MRAQKNFKSTTESQCFGGAAFGFEVCFQWNAWVADRPNVRPVSSRKGRQAPTMLYFPVCSLTVSLF